MAIAYGDMPNYLSTYAMFTFFSDDCQWIGIHFNSNILNFDEGPEKC